MKTKIYSIGVLLIVFAFSSCEDKLDTNPTGSVSIQTVFEDVEGGFAAINGVYRSFYRPQWERDGQTVGWSSGYATENFGQSSVNICADIMGEDFVEYDPGSAWFWYDYLYWVRTEYTNTSDRPYVWWKMYYTWIANANYIIAYTPGATGSEEDKNNLLGQAYALRAFSYFYLAQFYQRTYIGHEEDPGVPIYTEPTTKNTTGKGRGTLTLTYSRINDDLDEAIRLFQIGSKQRHISNIDLYVAYGLKARVALVQNNWPDAEKYAAFALEKPGLKLMTTAEIVSGFNSVQNKEWMWGSEVISNQATTWFSFFGHMDASAGYHASSAQKCVSKWLYDRIPANDIRKNWFLGPMSPVTEDTAPEDVSYCQRKFRDESTSLEGDLLYMRASEMYLILAEARCQQNDFQGTREALDNAIGYKVPDYADVLASRTDSKELTLKSTESQNVQTLMDEIILQRRIELWGEGFRIFDIMRLKTGFMRTYPGSNHHSDAQFDIDDPESWEWIMLIPQKEFDGNPNMTFERDQNPIQ